MKLDLSQPKTFSTVIAGIVTVLVVLPNLDKGWGVVRYITDAFPIAYAGKAVADETKDRFDQYIQQQQQAIETQNKIAEAIAGYTAQQQMPNQAAPQRQAPVIQNFIEWDDEGTCWQCQGVYDYEECWDQKLWRVCDPETKGM